jgi:hypothetical protein
MRALAAISLTLLVFHQAAMARQAPVLARDYPGAIVFLQMARRGVQDYTAQKGTFPPDLKAVESAGYTAYLFPTDWKPVYSILGDYVEIRNVSSPGFLGGQTNSIDHIEIRQPKPGLFHDSQERAPGGAEGEMYTNRVWHFPGAEWLHAGQSWTAVEAALRLDRIYVHLNWMTGEYNHATKAMPGSLRDLELMLGTERNPLAWSQVHEVGSASAVAAQAGNLFVGWDNGKWIVSINNGMEVETLRWIPGSEGLYIMEGVGGIGY